MSMLSAQVDRLRELATRYDELQAGTVRAVRIPLDTGSVLREAADTIWQLRDDLQRTNAENAKLREQSERLFDKTLELAIENTKLRELLDFALPIAMYAASTEEGDQIRELMREVEL